MQTINFDILPTATSSILCLGAHSDDIEIGALATILGLARKYSSAQVTWVVFSARGERAEEASASADHCTGGYSAADILLHEYRDGYFPQQVGPIKSEFDALKQRCNPDIIFTHNRSDRHQDHRVISDLTWQTFRNHLILEYEIPKYDGDFGVPNLFNSVSQDLCDEKLLVLERYFSSQRSKSWFTSDLFMALMRLRGMECNSNTALAEAFYCRKLVLA